MEEREAVERVLERRHPAAGPETERFEAALAAACGRRGGVATSSGTAALHLALLSLGARPGTRIGFPSYVCAAVLHAIRHSGATPVPLDVDPATGNLPAEPPRVPLDALVVPHMLGLPAPVEPLARAGIPLVEDCAMCLGTTVGGRPAGSWGAVSIVSTYATKMIATGHGGAALADDPERLAFLLDRVRYDERDKDAVRYPYRMSDLAATLGTCQLTRLPSFVAARRTRAAAYRSRLADGPWDLPPADPAHVYHRFAIRLRRGDVRAACEAAARRGIEMKRPVYLPAHRYLDLPDSAFPATVRIWETSLSLPIYPDLSDAEQERVCAFLDDWAAGRA